MSLIQLFIWMRRFGPIYLLDLQRWDLHFRAFMLNSPEMLGLEVCTSMPVWSPVFLTHLIAVNLPKQSRAVTQITGVCFKQMVPSENLWGLW